MPQLRSGLTKGDSSDAWRSAALRQMDRVCGALNASDDGEVYPKVISAAEAAREAFMLSNRSLPKEDDAAACLPESCPESVAPWLHDPLLKRTVNHVARSHMEDDFARYFYCSVFAEAMGRSPKAFEFPKELAPSHANWSSGHFADRFRAQPWDLPATTITSHIHKDGHYFIHPDPTQCRSLTVREAARIQTFPDNYMFLGNRTEQYIQVGNAVPPFLAAQIAGALWAALNLADAEAHAVSVSGELVQA
jgi:DNA (cytosine-5)-methyltransferase 1